jgi:GAF domain-containing protein
MTRDILMIPDARRDKRFAANPFVMGKPRFRFYAGAPLVTPDNRALGTLCVFDTKQRTLTTRQQTDLIALSRCIMTEMELRRTLMTERAQKKPAPRSQSAQRHSAGSRRA